MSAARSGRHAVRGLRLAYHEWGDPSAPALILIHGFQDHGQSFAQLAEGLADRYRVITPDVRGHGDSGWVGDGGDYHFYDYLGDQLALLEHLGLEQFALLGHSMGGNIAAAVGSLLKGRLRGLILLEGMGFLPHDLADSVARLERATLARARGGLGGDVAARRALRTPLASLEEAAARLRRYNARLDSAQALALATTFSEVDQSGSRVWKFDPLHKAPSAKPYLFEEATAMWRAIEAPVLSLYGSDSQYKPADLSLRHSFLREVRVGWVHEAGHNLHHDQPLLLAKVLKEWLDGDRNFSFPSGLSERAPTP